MIIYFLILSFSPLLCPLLFTFLTHLPVTTLHQRKLIMSVKRTFVSNFGSRTSHESGTCLQSGCQAATLEVGSHGSEWWHFAEASHAGSLGATSLLVDCQLRILD